jgi:hypothetical protein
MSWEVVILVLGIVFAVVILFAICAFIAMFKNGSFSD